MRGRAEKKTKKFRKAGRAHTPGPSKREKTIEAPHFSLPSLSLFSLFSFCSLREMRSLASCSGSAAAMPQASTSARTATAPASTSLPLLAAPRPRRRCPSRPFSSWSSPPGYYSAASRRQVSWIASAASEAAGVQATAPNSGGEEATSSSSDQSLISPRPSAAATATVRARRPLNDARVATLGASKSAARAVDEGARPLGKREGSYYVDS